MRSDLVWHNLLPEKNDIPPAIYCIAYKPDGSQLLITAANKVCIYDAVTGHLIDSLSGHSDTVYTIDYSQKGDVFASGGADKTVILWAAHRNTGKLKYTHVDSIQCIKFNPVSLSLLSCSSSDFGIWTNDSDVVPKTKVSSKILCCSWTPDGQFFAIGHYNGNVGIYTQTGELRTKITRSAPVWCLSFNPSIDEEYDILAVGSWDQTLSFYDINGKQVNGTDKYLHYDPCFVEYFSNGEYMCVGGSDKSVTLWTKHGNKLTSAATTEKWVWCAKQRPGHNYVAVGTEEGELSMHKLVFSTVHGLYQDRYVYRDFMTTVVVHHLSTDQKAVLNCNEYVKKVSIFKDRLAVQLPDRIVIYDLSFDAIQGINCKAKNKIMKKFECTLLVVAARHFVLCKERRIQLYNFEGDKEREWVMEAVIRYIKVVGGPPSREALLVGLKNGSVLKIFLDNTFPTQLAKLKDSIRCLDLSKSRRKLAVVDGSNGLYVYDLKNDKLVYQDSNAHSVAWNSDYEEMFCYSSNNSVIYTKTADFPVDQQKLQGFVVGFKGSKVFSLHYLQMHTVDIPQSAGLYRFIERKDWKNAYKIACLGVTDDDWKLLGVKSLIDMSFDVARKAFVRIHDIRFLELLNKLVPQSSKRSFNKDSILAEIYAYQGKFREAAELMIKNDQVKRAIDMYSDLRMWNEAKRIAATTKSVNVRELILKQAEQAERSKDLKAASELYAAAGEHNKAIAIMSKNGWTDRLLEVCRGLNKVDHESIMRCAETFVKFNRFDYAKEAYGKIGDYQQLLRLYVRMQQWDEAFSILSLHPTLSTEVYLPYAEYLALQDRFDEALEAFKKADAPEKAFNMIKSLCKNAVIEHRFKDASYYCLQLALETLGSITTQDWTREEETNFQLFQDYLRKAKIYHCYDEIFQFAKMPFSARDPLHLCNIARYLLLSNSSPTNFAQGVSQFNILYTLSSVSMDIMCFKLSRQAFEMMRKVKVPHALIDKIDLAHLRIRAKPFKDNPELIPLCYRCSSENPFLNVPGGDRCTTCLCPFERSFYSFEQLPLVEFVLPQEMSDLDAKRLIEQDPPKRRYGNSNNNMYNSGTDTNVLTLSYSEDMEEEQADPFNQLLLSLQSGQDYVPLTVTREVLLSMKRDQVFIVDWKTPGVRPKYFRNMVPDIPIAQCPRCQQFFHEQEYEYECLAQGGCPFCRYSEPKKEQ